MVQLPPLFFLLYCYIQEEYSYIRILVSAVIDDALDVVGSLGR